MKGVGEGEIKTRNGALSTTHSFVFPLFFVVEPNILFSPLFFVGTDRSGWVFTGFNLKNSSKGFGLPFIYTHAPKKTFFWSVWRFLFIYFSLKKRTVSPVHRSRSGRNELGLKTI